MRRHAILAASSAHRWLACTPSARLEETFPAETSIYAEEGSAAHALAEYKLKKHLEGIASQKTLKRPVSTYDCEEMEYFTDEYVDYASDLISEAHARSKDPIILLEQRLDFSEYVPEGFGTGDLVIVADGMLDVLDFKYGKRVEVSAENNPQIMLYGLGALTSFDIIYDINAVRMTIYQPRTNNISTYEMSAADLIKWAETELRPRAEKAFKGEGDFVAGDHCQFCLARAKCRERSKYSLKMAKDDFREPPLLTDDEISEILMKAKAVKCWVDDVWAYALKLAVNQGKKWEGFKLVEERSRRKYVDEGRVAEVLLKDGLYNEGQIYTKSLQGITAMEKLLGKKQFRSMLGNLVEKPPGQPKLVEESDKRPEIEVKGTENGVSGVVSSVASDAASTAEIDFVEE